MGSPKDIGAFLFKKLKQVMILTGKRIWLKEVEVVDGLV